ncbi:hypothetical protein [Microbacterium sp.]|uniref:hypothetical protein n=2 Tax=Micrococcales TaxID=85006 RepID=UPI003F9713B8
MTEDATPAPGDTDFTYLTEIEQHYLNELGEAVADHEVRLERLEAKEKEPPVPRDWIARHQSVQAWNELADWVDWLNANYSMPHARRVQECWPAHPGLVHVLAGLRSAWRASVLSDEQSKEQGNAMAAFHDYHLFPFFQRLEDTKLFKCSNGHKADDEHAATDRDRFPEGLVGEDEVADASPAPSVEPEGPEVVALPAQEGAGDLEDDSEWWRG